MASGRNTFTSRRCMFSWSSTTSRWTSGIGDGAPSRSSGDLDHELGSATRTRAGFDGAPMRSHDPATHGQAKAGAGGPSALKRLEEPARDLRRNSVTSVQHTNE